MTKIDVVVGSGRPVDEDSAEDAVPGLNGKVSVVPGRSVLQSFPAVCLSVTGRDGTLGDRRHTVILLKHRVLVNITREIGKRKRGTYVGIVLADTVPVNS